MQSIAVLTGSNNRWGLASPRLLLLGSLDIRDLILVLAAPKAGHMASDDIQRNFKLSANDRKIQGVLHLASEQPRGPSVTSERAGCSALLLPKDPLPIARQILDGMPMEVCQTPDLDYFLDEQPVKVVPFQKTFEEVKDEPFCILHTSGSTGIPKPVPIPYGSYGGMDSQLLIPSLGHKPTFLSYARGKRVFLALPVFHAASLNWTFGIALFAGVTCILPPPVPLSAELASQVFQYSNADGAIMAPSLVVDCYNNARYCERMLQKLKFIVYGGGMLPAGSGMLSARKLDC